MTQPGFWYFWTDLALVALTVGIVRWSWPRLDQAARRSACLTSGIVMILQVANEYLSLSVFHAWSFSFEHNRLIGWAVAGIPVEEYLFWFAFAWMVPFLYSGLSASPKLAAFSISRLASPVPGLRSTESAPPPAKGYWGWWLIGSVLFVLAALPWVGKRICWRALGWATAVFVSLMFLSESVALHWKWWIWNDAILWGPKVLQIPLEEFLLYFAIVPLLAVMQIIIQNRFFQGGRP